MWDAFFIEIQYRNTVKKRPAFCGPNKKSSRPDSNRRPTHYECVALPAEPRKLIKRFALTHILYTGFPNLASVFWKKVKLIYFWKNLKKVVDNLAAVVYYIHFRR